MMVRLDADCQKKLFFTRLIQNLAPRYNHLVYIWQWKNIPFPAPHSFLTSLKITKVPNIDNFDRHLFC